MPLTLAPKTGPVPLPHRLHRLRSRFRAIVVLRQGSLTLALIVAAIVGAGWLDWHFQLPALLRSIVLVGILTGAITLVVRAIVVPFTRNATLLKMAQRVERSFPELNESLASAIQFLELPEHALTGSPILRQETIQSVVDKAEVLDFSAAVGSRWTKRSLAALFLVTCVAFWIADRAPTASATAIERLFVPFGSFAWPAKTRVEILAPLPLPHRAARGDAVEIQFRLNGVVPDRARFSLWLDGASPTEQAVAVIRNEQSPVEGALVIRLESNRIPRGFKFRLRANDADTGWQSVEVLPPPVLAPRDGRPSPQIHLTFPSYTELAPLDLPDGSSTIEAVTGTQVRIRAAVDRPVARVSLRLQPDLHRVLNASAMAPWGAGPGLQTAASLILSREVWGEIPVVLSADGQTIDVDFVPRLSGSYVLRIEDEMGIVAQRHFDVRIQPDPSPTVFLERPTPSKDSLAVLPDAGFTIVAVGTDKIYALRRAWIEYRTTAVEPYRQIVAFDGEYVGRIIPHLSAFIRLPLVLPPVRIPRQQSYELIRWLPIQQFTHADGAPLREGEILRVRISADDYDNVTLNKSPGVSGEVELQIASKSQLDAMLQQQLALIRNEILALNLTQHEARTRVLEARQRLRQTGNLQREDIERLAKVEQAQQQIQARIASKEEGMLARTIRLKQTVLDNRLPRSATTHRIDTLFGDLKRLVDEELTPIEPLIAAARRDLDKSPTPLGAQALERAERHQKEVEETLRSLLERLEPWSGAGEMRGEARSILNDLRRQMEALEQIRQAQRPQTVGSKRSALTPEAKNELDRVALRPERLAERIRQMLEKMGRQVDDKELALTERLEQLQQKEREADAKSQEAERQPRNSPAERDLRKQSEARRAEADELRDSIKSIQAELEALKAALKTSDPQALRQQAQDVPQQIRENQLGDAQSAQQRTSDRLEKMVEALEERGKEDDSDLLQKKRKKLDENLDQLIEDQERLQKKIDDARKLTDPEQRAETLKRLAPEQERLEKAAQELVQSLVRAGADESAQQLRRAARQMEQARQQLEQGIPPDLNQEEALNHLDQAQESLQPIGGASTEELIREQITKAADQMRALRERQFAAVEEEKRLSAKAVAARRWDLATAKQSLPDLLRQQETLTADVRSLIDKRFMDVPVFARMLRQSAEAMDQAVVQLRARESLVIDQLEGISDFSSELEEAADRRIRNRQELALKRLDRMLESLKPDKEMFKPRPKRKEGDPMMAEPKGPPSDVLPPLAQLKALRFLQTDLAEQTAAFDAAHPNRAKLTDDELAELEGLKKAQLDVAELVQSLIPAPMREEQP